jgi:hypothetical protein
MIAVALPQPFKLFAADFLVDFLENIAHGTRPSPYAQHSHITQNPHPARLSPGSPLGRTEGGEMQ